MFRPFVLFAAAYISGLISAEFDKFSYFSFTLFTLCFIYIFYRVRKSRTDMLTAFLVLLVCLFMYLFGIQKADEGKIKNSLEEMLEDGNSYHSVVASVRDRSEAGEKVKIRAEVLSVDGAKDGGYQILIYIDSNSLVYGDIIEFEDDLMLFDEAMNEGEFDAKAYYRCRNVFASAHPDSYTLSGREKGAASLFRFFNIVKSGMIENLRSVLEESYAGVMESMLTGDRYGLDKDVREDYAKAGFVHILAISGLHISVIGLGIFGFLRRKGRSLSFSVSLVLILLVLYCLFSGTQVSCQRAVIMSGLTLASMVFGRKYDGYSALSIAAIVILTRQPLYLYDSSFLLSFSAGFGIVLVGKLNRETELLVGGRQNMYTNEEYTGLIGKIKNRLFLMQTDELRQRAVRGILFAICLQLVLLPVQLCFYYSFCPYTVILNIILLPAMPVLLLLGLFISAFAGILPLPAGLAAYPLRFILDIYLSACKKVSGLPFGRIVTGRPEFWRLLAYASIFALFVFIHGKTKRLFAYLILLFLFLPLILPRNSSPCFYQLYVGQGDCGVIISGSKAYIIDCGSGDRQGIYEYTVEKFLNYHGIVAPYMVFLSHSDKDHVNGFMEYLASQNEEPPFVFIPELRDESGFSAVTAYYEGYEEKIFRLSRGNLLEDGKLSFRVLYPDEKHAGASENENSMVLYVETEGFKALYTGDIPKEADETVLKEMEKLGIDSKIDLLKVPHHGSRFSCSEEFLSAIKPHIAVVSAGIGNPYGHPAKELLERLEKTGCEVHVTAEEGEVMIDKKSQKVYTIR